MDVGKWLRLQWDRVLAWAFVVVGAIALIIGWVGVSGSAYAAGQLPYIISGGIGGIFLLGVGATLWLSADLRDEWRKLDCIEDALREGSTRSRRGRRQLMAEVAASGRLGTRARTIGAPRTRRARSSGALGCRGPAPLGHHRRPGRCRRGGGVVRRRRGGHLRPAGRPDRCGPGRAVAVGDRQPGLAAARPSRARRAAPAPAAGRRTPRPDRARCRQRSSPRFPAPSTPTAAEEVFLAGEGMERYHRSDCALAAGRSGWTTATRRGHEDGRPPTVRGVPPVSSSPSLVLSRDADGTSNAVAPGGDEGGWDRRARHCRPRADRCLLGRPLRRDWDRRRLDLRPGRPRSRPHLQDFGDLQLRHRRAGGGLGLRLLHNAGDPRAPMAGGRPLAR